MDYFNFKTFRSHHAISDKHFLLITTFPSMLSSQEKLSFLFAGLLKQSLALEGYHVSLWIASYLLLFHSDKYFRISKSNISIISSRASMSILREDSPLHSYISTTYRDPYPPRILTRRFALTRISSSTMRRR